MSRFKGWTAKDIETIQKKNIVREITYVKLDNTENCVDKICYALDTLKIKYIREYKFLADRRFRFDIAIPKYKIAIEYEGGIYKNSRHTRPLGYAKDTEKYNLAVINGWRLLRYTTFDTKFDFWEYKVLGDVNKLIK